MIYYELPSGIASVSMTRPDNFSTDEYTYPIKRKELESALKEALRLLAIKHSKENK